MSVLHIVNKSPFERNSLDTCLRLARADSAILLIEDGTYAATRNSAAADRVGAALGQHKIFALEPDLDARGIVAERVIDGIELVDYAGFVELTTRYARVQSWL